MFLTEKAKISKPGHKHKTINCIDEAYLSVCRQSGTRRTNAGFCIPSITLSNLRHRLQCMNLFPLHANSMHRTSITTLRKQSYVFICQESQLLITLSVHSVLDRAHLLHTCLSKPFVQAFIGGQKSLKFIFTAMKQLIYQVLHVHLHFARLFFVSNYISIHLLGCM